VVLRLGRHAGLAPDSGTRHRSDGVHPDVGEPAGLPQRPDRLGFGPRARQLIRRAP
jgi:hypothetical protein